jgi:UDP-N-acetylglucosamine acyltransferase
VTTGVHSTAIIDPTARLGEGVEVGPFTIIGPNVIVGDRTVIGPHVTLERNVTLGSDVFIGQGTILGGAPQDLKYQGGETAVRVGDRTIIREYVTVNRGSARDGQTVIGEDCFLMSYVHIAHDCVVFDHVTIVNGTQMAGHVTIQDHVILSGLVVIHQFCTVGSYAFVAGGAGVLQDIPPYTKALERKLYGLNSVGLQRAGFSTETVQALKRAYRLVFNSKLNLTQAIARARAELPMLDEVKHFLDFVESSGRGVTG